MSGSMTGFSDREQVDVSVRYRHRKTPSAPNGMKTPRDAEPAPAVARKAGEKRCGVDDSTPVCHSHFDLPYQES